MYNASKAALHSMSDTLRVELSPFDIKVTTVRFNSGSIVVDYDQVNPLPSGCIGILQDQVL